MQQPKIIANWDPEAGILHVRAVGFTDQDLAAIACMLGSHTMPFPPPTDDLRKSIDYRLGYLLPKFAGSTYFRGPFGIEIHL